MEDDDKTPVADHVPDTPAAPAVEKPADAPTAPASDSGLREVVSRLEETVSGLAAQVAALAPVHEHDKTPTNLPWTHRGR